jgi:subtilisin family serine protease
MSETSRVVDGRSRSFNVPIPQQHVVATSVKIEEGVMVGIRMPSKGGHRIMMLEWELHRFGALPTAAPAVSGTAAFEDAKFNEKYRLARQGAKSTEPVAKVYPLDDLFGPSARSPQTTAAFAKALAAILPKTAGQFKPSPRGKANEEYDCAIMVNGDEDSHRNVVQILRGLRGGRAETKTVPAAN